jgi:hypothetical protein
MTCCEYHKSGGDPESSCGGDIKPAFQLDKLASELVADGKTPNLFFVTVKADCLLATRDFDLAYAYWRQLPRDVETMLEDRLIGVICSTEPVEEHSTKLITYDDSYMARKTL